MWAIGRWEEPKSPETPINFPLLSNEIHNKIVVAISCLRPFIACEENLFVTGHWTRLAFLTENIPKLTERNVERLTRKRCVQ
jgi:hypothetical protein